MSGVRGCAGATRRAGLGQCGRGKARNVGQGTSQENEEAWHRDRYISVAPAPFLPGVASDIDAIAGHRREDPHEQSRGSISPNEDIQKGHEEQDYPHLYDELCEDIEAAAET